MSIAGNDDYRNFFRSMIELGWSCGLYHPIQIAVNAHRTPGLNLGEDYYTNLEKHLPRFLFEIFLTEKYRKPKNAREVLDLVHEYYRNNFACKNYFDFLESPIQEFIASAKYGSVAQLVRASGS